MSYKHRNTYATLPRTQRGMPLVLGGDPKGKTFLYTNGNSVIIRDIDNPSNAEIYTEHSQQTTIAKYSPSGFYIASADQSGKIRIWDTTQKEHILKNEFQPFVGTVKDLSWSNDNQRIVVVGEGRERFGHVFMSDTGTSVGEIAGHSNLINSCDFRPARPFRIITGSEDNSVGIYEGPPFKFKMTLNDHTRYVQSVRFSPNGEFFASGGFDGKMFLYKTADYSKVGEFGNPAHGGGVYAVSFSPDGRQLLSASGDKSCKIWDVATLEQVTEFVLGHEVQDQQVSCLWQGKHLLSISLSGFINYLNPENPSKPHRIIKGHNKSITSLGLSPDKLTVFTGSHDGFVTMWDVGSGDQDRIQGLCHSNQVQDMTTTRDSLYTCGLDDTIRCISLATKQFGTTEIKLDSQPRGIAAGEGSVLVVAGVKHITIIDNGQKVNTIEVDFEPSCAAVHPKESDVVIGGGKDSKVHVFMMSGSSLSLKKTMDHRAAITDVAFSPDGAFLAAADANRFIILYSAASYQPAHNLDWCFHTARVNSLSWSPDSLHLASGSLDTNIIIWSAQNPSKHLIIKKAHPQSQITRVAWLDNQSLVSTGQDSNLKVWDVDFTD